MVTAQKREIHLRTYLPLLGNQIDRYHKIVKLTMENISDSAISQISVDCIEFDGFKFKTDVVPLVRCLGHENAKYISWLLLPGESLTIIVDVFFDNPLYKNFWEYEDSTSIGNFDMCLHITNKSLSGIECKEKIFKRTKTSGLVDEHGNQSPWNIYNKLWLSEQQDKGVVPSNFITEFENRQSAGRI